MRRFFSFALFLAVAILASITSGQESYYPYTLISPSGVSILGPMPLPALLDSALPLIIEHDHPPLRARGPVQCEVDTVGLIVGHVVLGIFYSLEFGDLLDTAKWFRANWAKAIVIETLDGQFGTLFLDGMTRFENCIEPSFIGIIEGRDILATDCVQPGSGAYHIEEFWVWSEREQRPVILHLGRLGRAQNRLLPPGHEVKLSGSAFDPREKYCDIYSLREDKCTWGGRLRLTLGFEGDNLVVRSGRFDYDQFSDAAYRANMESCDTTYMTTAPVILDGFDLAEINR